MIRGSIAAGAGLMALVAGFLAVPSAHAATTTAGSVTYVTTKATIGENGTDEVASPCPGETSASGGGAGFTDEPMGFDSVEFAGMYPYSALLGVPDDGYEAAMAVGAVGSRTVKVTAICLEPSDDPDAQTYANSTSSVGAGAVGSSTGEICPTGKVTGGGFEPYDAPDPADVEAEEIGLQFLSDDDPSTNQVALSFGKEGPGFDYRVHAMCSTYNLKHVHKALVAYPGTTTIKVACPQNRHAVGGGFGRYPTDVLVSEPYDSKDKGKAPDDGWRFKLRSAAGIQAMYTWAACMKP